MSVTFVEDNRPNVSHLKIDFGQLNTFTPEKMQTVRNRLDDVPDGTSVLTISAANNTTNEDAVRGLSAGLDLEYVKNLNASEAHNVLKAPYEMMQTLRDLDVVTVCGCGDYALGIGFEMALSCDYRIATNKAKLGVPEVHAGLPTIIQGGLLIPYLGLQRAKEICFEGEILSGSQAETIDLINHSASIDNYVEKFDEVVDMLAAKSPTALRFQKQVFQKWRSNGLETGMRDSIEIAALAFDTPDQKEGIEALLNNREPEFEDL